MTAVPLKVLPLPDKSYLVVFPFAGLPAGVVDRRGAAGADPGPGRGARAQARAARAAARAGGGRAGAAGAAGP